MPLKAGWWYFFLKLLFYVGVHTLQYKVIVLGVQQRDSVMHLYVSLLSQILFPIVLLQYNEHNSPPFFLKKKGYLLWLSIVKRLSI